MMLETPSPAHCINGGSPHGEGDRDAPLSLYLIRIPSFVDPHPCNWESIFHTQPRPPPIWMGRQCCAAMPTNAPGICS